MSKEVIEYRDVFCPVCGTFFDLRQVGTEYRCRKCGTQKSCTAGKSVSSNSRMMFTRSVVEFPGATDWLDVAVKEICGSTKDGENDPGAQRALVAEDCPKCKNPKMYFWTQQLRSADEGQTIFYECPECDHRYSVNS